MMTNNKERDGSIKQRSTETKINGNKEEKHKKPRQKSCFFTIDQKEHTIPIAPNTAFFTLKNGDKKEHRIFYSKSKTA